MIVLEARAGLGNRMYSIASAYYLAKNADQKLVVLWDVDKSLGARADILFPFQRNFDSVYDRVLLKTRADQTSEKRKDQEILQVRCLHRPDNYESRDALTACGRLFLFNRACQTSRASLY